MGRTPLLPTWPAAFLRSRLWHHRVAVHAVEPMAVRRRSVAGVMMAKREIGSFAFIGVATLLLLCCSSAPKPAQPAVLSNSSGTAGGVAITDEMIGRSRGAMKLSTAASDPQYGYSERLPVMIGGGFGEGSDRTYKYLNALRGPNGEAVAYDRVGTCCPFKSPHSPFGGEALLEVYEITIRGSEGSKRLYFNWYDDGPVLVPVGLSAVK